MPVGGPSLSQEIRGAVWSFDVDLESPGAIAVDWDAALHALLGADALIWNDTDKKGRPRQRDCRASLQSLEIMEARGQQGRRLRLEAGVDEMGRSLRPAQIQHWLAEQLNQPIAVDKVCRDALVLARC